MEDPPAPSANDPAAQTPDAAAADGATPPEPAVDDIPPMDSMAVVAKALEKDTRAKNPPVPIKQLFRQKKKKMTVVVAALIGIPGVDMADEAFLKKSKVNKTDYNPSLAERREEIRRRCAFNNIPEQKCRSWGKKECDNWLAENLITDESEQRDAVSLHKAWKMMKESEVESRRTDVSLKHLRAIEVAFDPGLRDKFITRHDKKERPQIDARNSDKRETSFYEDAAERFNDNDRVYETVAYSADDWLPSTFYDKISLPGPGCESKEVNPESYKKILTDLRAKTIRVIKNWEKSGNGDGNRESDNEESFSNDTRMKYVTTLGYDPSVPYYWKRAEDLDLLENVTQDLGDEHGGGSDQPARKVGRKKKKKKKGNKSGPIAVDSDDGDEPGTDGTQSAFLKSITGAVKNLANPERTKREQLECSIENLRAEKGAAQKNFSDLNNAYSEMLIRSMSAGPDVADRLKTVLADQEKNVAEAKKDMENISTLFEERNVELEALIETEERGEQELKKKPPSTSRNKRKSDDAHQSEDDSVSDSIDEEELRNVSPEDEAPHKESAEVDSSEEDEFNI